jgi:chromosome segregation ATPase
MEIEQINKQLEWLDEEHRKDKSQISQLSKQLVDFESKIKSLSDQLEKISNEKTVLSSLPDRINLVDDKLEQTRDDLLKKIEEQEKGSVEIHNSLEKKLTLELKGINKSIDQIQKISDLKELKDQMAGRILEENRLNKSINVLEGKFAKEKNKYNELELSIQIIEDNFKQENKKTGELQNDISALKRKLDDLRNKLEIIPENVRRIDTRINELTISETERRYSQKSFIEQQALQQIDRDQVQRELRDKIEKLGKQSQQYENQLQQWDPVQREVQKAKEVYENLTQKFERRINEITEMQRLSEDRFRQEWATFKADYQKRWTSYSLSQDELFNEMNQDVNSIAEKISPIEDLVQTQIDIVQQTIDVNEEYFQGVLAQINQLLSSFNRISGSSKK